MYLRVNGVPLYVRGANVIPFDVLPTRASRANLTRLLQAAKRANMNTIRIWSVEGCLRVNGNCSFSEAGGQGAASYRPHLQAVEWALPNSVGAYSQPQSEFP